MAIGTMSQHNSLTFLAAIEPTLVRLVAPCATIPDMKQISQRELRNQSGQIMRALEGGESFVVTRDGTPVGELIPLRRRRGARLATVLEIFRSAPRTDARRFRKDLDAIAGQDPKPRG